MTVHWLLLTATVRAPTSVRVSVADPVARAGQYRAAISAWRRLAPALGARIAVVENSGAAEDELFADVAGAPGSPPPVLLRAEQGDPRRGKGAMEADMIDQALAQLEVAPGELVAKCTGRLVVPNAARAVPPFAAGAGERAPAIVLRATLGGSYVDTRLLVATTSAWSDVLAGMAQEVDEDAGHFLEHVVADRVHLGRSRQALAVHRFRQRPRFAGYSGTSGERYDTPAGRLRRVAGAPVEALLRRLPPDKQF